MSSSWAAPTRTVPISLEGTIAGRELEQFFKAKWRDRGRAEGIVDTVDAVLRARFGERVEAALAARLVAALPNAAVVAATGTLAEIEAAARAD